MSIELHIDWRGRTHLVGRLYPAQQGAMISFEYDSSWINRADAFPIDPTSLPIQNGVQHRSGPFGAIQDCGPDRWGRVLIERAVRKHVLLQKPYRDIDYVLALNDITRIGALRFRDKNGIFLADDKGEIPPVVQLNALLRAADAIHTETETTQDLRFLLGAGSPLGGARPKSIVLLPDGQMALAKFPKPDDTRDIGAGEILALALAKAAGICTATGRLISLQNKSVSIITRFDRVQHQRVPFISALSLLGLPKDDPGSYTQIADAIRQFGLHIQEDLHELWRRMIFSLLTNNFDDHLRNHGFLMLEPGRWSLSPAYDLNPVPEIERVQFTKTDISENHEESSIDSALSASPRFSLKFSETKTILKEVCLAVSEWHRMGKKLKLKSKTMDSYATAFQNPLMTEAKQLISRV